MAKFRINRTVFLLLLVLIIIVIGYVYSTSVSNKEGLITWKGLPGQMIATDTIQSYDNVVNAEACQQHCINNKKCVAITINNDPLEGSKKNVCKLKAEAPDKKILERRHSISFLKQKHNFMH